VAEIKLSNIFKGGVLILFGSIISLGFNYLMRLVAARGLQPANYGSYVLATTIISITSTFCLFGLDTGIGRFLPRLEEKKERTRYLFAAIFVSLLLAIIFMCLLYLFPNSGYERIFGNSISKDIFVIFLFSLPFMIIFKVSIGYSQGNQTAKARVLLKDISLPTVKLLTLYLAIEFSLGLTGVSYSYVISYILISAICVVYLIKNISTFQILPKKDDFTVILGFSAPLLITSIMTFIFRDADNLLLGLYATGQDIAIYDINYRTAMISLVLINSIAFLFLPAISELDSNGEIDKIREVFNSVNKLTIIGSSPIVFILILYPSYVVSLLFGPEYNSPLTLRVLVLGMYFHIFFGPIGNALTSIGFSKLLMYDNTISSLLNVFLNIILIPMYGMVGAAIATTLAFMFLNILYAIQFREKIGISIVNITKIKSVIIVGFSMIITLPIKVYIGTLFRSLIISTIIFTLSISALSLIFMLTPKEFNIIMSKIGLK
jgi:O-antigen/teichoic acid export membrane protein